MIELVALYDSDGTIILRPLPEPIVIERGRATLHRMRSRLPTLAGVAPEADMPIELRHEGFR